MKICGGAHQRAGAHLERVAGGRGLLGQGGVALRGLVDLAHRLVDLAHACDCSPVAWLMPRTSSLIWPTEVTTVRITSSGGAHALRAVADLVDRAADQRADFLAAAAERCASARTSEATTAKPLPCSPARADSTAALSARMLVWKAMPSITWITLADAARRLLDALHRPHQFEHRRIAALSHARRGVAGLLICCALAAVSRTEALICSIAEAVCSTLADCSSVRAAVAAALGDLAGRGGDAAHLGAHVVDDGLHVQAGSQMLRTNAQRVARFVVHAPAQVAACDLPGDVGALVEPPRRRSGTRWKTGSARRPAARPPASRAAGRASPASPAG